MPRFVCEACGTQFADSEQPPSECPICEDERQPRNDQAWTTPEQLRGRHRAELREQEPGLLGIGAKPAFAIGQRALLLESATGNVLWDCISLLDDELVSSVEERGGVATVAISHPHFYAAMVDWAEAFDARIVLHGADREWVVRPNDRIEHWEGETHELGPGLTLLRLGGHFDGGTVLHWAAGQERRGALLSGDIVQVVPDPGWVSFMYSFPNLIPLPAAEVLRIAETLEPYAFDRIYGAWWDRVVPSGGKDAVRRSAARYARRLENG